LTKIIEKPSRDPDYTSERGVKYYWAPEWVRELNGTICRIKVVKNGNDADLHMVSKSGNTSYIQGRIQKAFRKWHTDRQIDYILLGVDEDTDLTPDWEKEDNDNDVEQGHKYNRLLDNVDKSIQDSVVYWTQAKPSSSIRIDNLSYSQVEKHYYKVGLAIKNNNACLVIFDEDDVWISVIEEYLHKTTAGTLHRHWSCTGRNSLKHHISDAVCNFHQAICNSTAEKLLKELAEEKMEEIIFGKK
jgi:hypothetical protein